MRPSLLKYNIMFTLEEIVGIADNNDPSIYGELRDSFSRQVYEIDKNIFTSLENDYPSQFDSYKTLFMDLNYYNMCNKSPAFTSNSVK